MQLVAAAGVASHAVATAAPRENASENIRGLGVVPSKCCGVVVVVIKSVGCGDDAKENMRENLVDGGGCKAGWLTPDL